MANIITCIRIICSIVLLFCPVFSPVFYALYITAGVSDMLDGAVARKTGTVSEFGSKLDTFERADHAMYKDKKAYYSRNNIDRRRT